jgi:cysteinyl-tRNA synthetase
MTCWDRTARRWLRTQYAPDPSLPGAIPAHKPASMVHLCAFPNGVDDATVAELREKMQTARDAGLYNVADSIRAVLRAAGVSVANERKPA